MTKPEEMKVGGAQAVVAHLEGSEVCIACERQRRKLPGIGRMAIVVNDKIGNWMGHDDEIRQKGLEPKLCPVS